MNLKKCWIKYESVDFKEEPWVGFDVDGTLANYDGYDPDQIDGGIGELLVDTEVYDRIWEYINSGVRVKIFTARAAENNIDDINAVKRWLDKNGFPELEITAVKDCYCRMIFDDRAIQVERNTGKILGDVSLIKEIFD